VAYCGLLGCAPTWRRESERMIGIRNLHVQKEAKMKRNSLITRFRTLAVAVTLASAFVLGACVIDTPEPDDVTEAVLESTASESTQEDIQPSQEGLGTEAICPLRWTCDSISYYSTQSACVTACGGEPCYRDYDCRGTCLCP
jgi:hypothetical protein